MKRKNLTEICNELKRIEGALGALDALEANKIAVKIGDLAADLKNHIDNDDAKKAAKGWTAEKGFVLMFCSESRNIESTEIRGFRSPEFPGLFIHREVMRAGMPGKGWAITHEPSGKSIKSGFSSMKKAAKLVKDCLTGINWDRPADEVLSDSGAREAIFKIDKLAA